MDIKCTRYPYLWGKKLLVDGREVAFDASGVSKNVDPVAGTTLVQAGGYVDVTLPTVEQVAAVVEATVVATKRVKQPRSGS